MLQSAELEIMTAALLVRYRSDPDFRAAVDDMTAATGLVLPDSPVGSSLDDVYRLARFRREEARLGHSTSDGSPSPHGGSGAGAVA